MIQVAKINPPDFPDRREVMPRGTPIIPNRIQVSGMENRFGDYR